MSGLLLEISEPGKPARRIAVKDGLTFGRGSHNDCVLDDTKVSESHARIIRIHGSLCIQDLGSSNRTHIFQGASLAKDEEWCLKPGGRFMIGSVEFVVLASTSGGVDPTVMPPGESPAPRSSGSPLDLPLDGGHRGPVLAPHSGLAPGRDGEALTGEERSDFDTGMLKFGKKGAPAPEVESTIISTPKPPAPSAPESTIISTPKPPEPPAPESTVISTPDVADSAEGKTISAQMPIIEDAIGDSSEGKTVGLDLSELGSISPTAERTTENARGPDPDEETILSPPPSAPGSDVPTDKVAHDAADSDETFIASPLSKLSTSEGTTDQVVVTPDGATVLSPHVSARAAEKTVETDSGKARPLGGEPTPEPTVLSSGSPGAQARSFASEATKAVPPGKAVEQRFAMMQPRLIFSDARFKFVSRLTKNNFSIGRASRSTEAHVDCAIDHPTVSAEHAVVLFRDGRFFLEDRGSRNGTRVSGRDLEGMTRDELKVDTPIRLGRVDGLFIVDRDHRLSEPDRGHYRAALEYLVRKKTIRPQSAESLWQASSRENQHPGEKLILEGRIAVGQWCEALKAAKSDQSLTNSTPMSWKWLAFTTTVLALVVLALILKELGIV